MATIKFLDPRVTLNPKDRPLVPGLDTLEGRVIGIIDNGQANSTAMFQELAQLIGEKFHTKEVLFKTKPTHMQGRAETDYGGNLKPLRRGDYRFGRLRVLYVVECPRRHRVAKKGKPTVTALPVDFMELARTEAEFFGLSKLPLVEIPHHPSGARPGEHRADAEEQLIW